VRDPDGELLAALREGNEAAFRTIVTKYHPAMLRLAHGFVPSAAVAEEVVQETWLAVLRGIERFEGRSSVKTWLFRILVNRARTTGQREHRTVPFDPGAEPAVPVARFGPDGAWSAPPVPWVDDADSRLAAEDLAGRIRRILPTLPDMQRDVLVLRDVEGLSAGEVCEVLGLTEGNQRVLLHRARARVREALELELGRV